MKISDVAEASGLSVDTLRFYEKIGLIDPPARDASGRRDYDADVLAWIRFIDQLNATGMKQADRVQYAALRRQGAATYTQRRQMLEAHRTRVANQLQHLKEVMELMDRKVALYQDLEAQEQAYV